MVHVTEGLFEAKNISSLFLLLFNAISISLVNLYVALTVDIFFSKSKLTIGEDIICNEVIH
jgi:hypothetical protein